MKYLDLTLPSPAENLALDEVLLEVAEQEGTECLRFWEARSPFVVLGLSNRADRETNRARCEQLGVPILRRFSGGGTIVQGPGCLSFALALVINSNPLLDSVSTSNRFIMETHRAAVEKLVGGRVTVKGHTDLETGGRKFSGNAQRRGRRALLFHGTFLMAADLELFAKLLNPPSREPEWRDGRSHIEFTANASIRRDRLVDQLRTTWKADREVAIEKLMPSVQRLAPRHRDPDWIFRKA